MIVIILGGILGGVFTPTEASAVAVMYGVFTSLFVYRDLRLSISFSARLLGLMN